MTVFMKSATSTRPYIHTYSKLGVVIWEAGFLPFIVTPKYGIKHKAV